MAVCINQNQNRIIQKNVALVADFMLTDGLSENSNFIGNIYISCTTYLQFQQTLSNYSLYFFYKRIKDERKYAKPMETQNIKNDSK